MSLKFKIAKGTFALELTTFEFKLLPDGKKEYVNKAILELAPTLPDASKGMPKAGEKRYNYEKKINISFNPVDMLKISYALTMICFGNTDIEYKKMGDLSKADPTKKGIKSLSIKVNDKGAVAIFLSEDKKDGNKHNVTGYLDLDEAWAMAKWFEVTYSKLYPNPNGVQDE